MWKAWKGLAKKWPEMVVKWTIVTTREPVFNFSNSLDLINLQEQINKTFRYQQLFWPFTVRTNCSTDLKMFANSQISKQLSITRKKKKIHSRSEQFSKIKYHWSLIQSWNYKIIAILLEANNRETLLIKHTYSTKKKTLRPEGAENISLGLQVSDLCF